MKTVYTSFGFALGASAAALVPRDQCCFGLTTSGGVSGQVGQLSDGQNRIAQTGGLDKQTGQYCLNNGQVTDGNGRGCILTPPTTQWQCDVGASPTGGFSVQNGNLAHDGSDQFYACPTGDNGGYNIYIRPVENQQGCVTVTLSTGGKCSGGSSSAPASSASASSAPASSAPASSAPAPSAPAPSAPASSAPAPSAPAPAPSAPAPSAPAPSAPAPSAPAPSAPAPSAPAPSAPAPSAPAPSAPAPSAPAPSAPASCPPAPPAQTTTIYSTSYHTVTSCAEGVQCGGAPSSVPASSAPAPSAPAPSAPAPSAPAPSAPAPSAPAPASSSSAPASSAPAPSSSAPASSAPAPSSSAPAPSAPAPSSSVPAPSATSSTPSKSGSACQTALSGAYQTPHAIIPVDQNSPSKSYGTQYNAYLGGGNSTIFNFDIPQDYSGKQCSVIFLFPQQKDLETSSFTQSGSGSLTFSKLSSAAGLDVSYSSVPKVESQIGQVNNVAPGNSYAVSTGACAAGTTQSIQVSASGDYKLSFFEDWNPSPIGVFITSC